MKRIRHLIIPLAYILIILLSGAPSALADISFDASSTASAVAVDTMTWTHTMGAGSNGALLVSFYSQGAGVPSAVSAGGVAGTQISIGVNSGTRTQTLWYVLNPGSGSISVTATSSLVGTDMGATASSYFGVDQGATVIAGSSTCSLASGTQLSCQVDNPPTGGVGVFGHRDESGGTYSGNSTTTSIRIQDGGAAMVISDSADFTISNPVVMTHSDTNSNNNWKGVMAILNPASSTPSSTAAAVSPIFFTWDEE